MSLTWLLLRPFSLPACSPEPLALRVLVRRPGQEPSRQDRCRSPEPSAPLALEPEEAEAVLLSYRNRQTLDSK
ncbi:MAG TPA: hypothetical protein VGL70_15665 [Candidatus Binatia bacterium]